MHHDAAAGDATVSTDELLAEIADRATDVATRRHPTMSRLRARLEAIEATIDLRDNPRPLRAVRLAD